MPVRSSSSARASLQGGGRRNRDPRKVDGEDATLLSEVARINAAVVLFDAPATEGEAQAQPCSIRPALLERPEQLVDISARKAAAFVLDFDEHAFDAGTDSEHDGGSRSGELEGVLQQVDDDGGEDLPVRFDD